MSLLPYNATKFEKDVESAIKYKIDASGLAGFKFSDYGNLRLSLIWEYSLARVNIDDLKTKITEGLKFHRLAGTPYSLRQALSWYNLKDIIIEEEEPGEHFAEFQVGFKEIPDGFAINTIINVAEMAKPLRSRLTRMYNEDYDIRRFILDSSDWGDLLSDHSGTQIYEDSPKLSFGRKMFCDAKLDTYNTLAYKQTTRVTFAKFEDTFKLDFGRLDDTKFGEPTEKNFYSAEKQTQNTDRVGDKIPDQLIKLRTFSRAMIVLSESVLEDGQSCFSGNYEEANDEIFLLDFSYLSETPTNNLYITTEFDFADGNGYTIREFGLFLNTITNEELPKGQKYFLPTEIEDPGELLMLENSVPIIRTGDTCYKCSFVLSL